jgi:uncharacterized membrane protein YbhN (UPF0104 family)
MNGSSWKRRWIFTAKAAVTILVLWAVGRHMLRTWDDIRHHEVALRVQPGWLVLSGVLYLAGICCNGRYYGRLLKAGATPIATFPSMRAYLISHLGKYVPGKAMVVIMRAGLSVPYGARAATSAIATFYETLVMMACGGLLAALGFALAGASPRFELPLPRRGTLDLELYQLAALLGLGMGLGFLVLVLPPVFRRLGTVTSLPFGKLASEAMPRISGGLLLEGLLWSSASWILLGCSQIEAAHGFRPLGKSEYLSLIGVVIASVALATVAGFVVAVLPGGLGIREGVLMYALAPAIGEDQAVVAALALRLIWVAAELLVALILLPLGRPRTAPESTLEAEARST